MTEEFRLIPIEDHLREQRVKYDKINQSWASMVTRCLIEAGMSEQSVPSYSFNVDALPRMAQLAFGARCAKRLLMSRLNWSGYEAIISECGSIIQLVENVAVIADWNNPDYRNTVDKIRYRVSALREQVITLPEGLSWIETFDVKVRPLVIATILVAEATVDDYADNYDTAEAYQKISLAGKLAWGGVPTKRDLIGDNFLTLVELAKKEYWDDNHPVSPEVFALLSSFNTDLLVPKDTILQISSAIDTKLLSYFRDNPQRMYELTPREFEEIIAELFKGFGFDAKLLAQTRDGGRDIIAIDNRVAQAKYLIECKRHAPQRKVGLSVVQRLHGVVQGEGATKGIIVTTSWFTQPAKAFIDKHQWQLEGWDFDHLTEWLKIYDKFKMLS